VATGMFTKEPARVAARMRRAVPHEKPRFVKALPMTPRKTRGRTMRASPAKRRRAKRVKGFVRYRPSAGSCTVQLLISCR